MNWKSIPIPIPIATPKAKTEALRAWALSSRPRIRPLRRRLCASPSSSSSPRRHRRHPLKGPLSPSAWSWLTSPFVPVPGFPCNTGIKVFFNNPPLRCGRRPGRKPRLEALDDSCPGTADAGEGKELLLHGLEADRLLLRNRRRGRRSHELADGVEDYRKLLVVSCLSQASVQVTCCRSTSCACAQRSS